MKNKVHGISFNPHWIGSKHCRDYKIGNIILRDVPDDFVISKTTFRNSCVLNQGHVSEFVDSIKLEIRVNDWWEATNVTGGKNE